MLADFEKIVNMTLAEDNDALQEFL